MVASSHKAHVEAVFDELDPEDKDEFKSMGEARKKQRHKRAMAETELGSDNAAAPKKKGRPKMKLRKRPAAAPAAAVPLPAAAAAPPLPAPGAAVLPPAPAPLQAPEAAVPPPAAELHLLPPPAAPLAPLPPPAEPPPDIIMGVAAAPLDADVEVPRFRGPDVLPGRLLWTNIVCPKCGKHTADKKFHPNPGDRDGPSWTLRQEVFNSLDFIDAQSWPRAKQTPIRMGACQQTAV